jgi:hypothetical protein
VAVPGRGRLLNLLAHTRIEKPIEGKFRGRKEKMPKIKRKAGNANRIVASFFKTIRGLLYHGESETK